MMFTNVNIKYFNQMPTEFRDERWYFIDAVVSYHDGIYLYSK